jgi:uncharacterized protein (DUF362 family)
MGSSGDFRTQSLVAVERCSPAGYSDERVLEARFRSLAEMVAWGRRSGGALELVIPDGARVLVKPNLVLHKNLGGSDFDAVITHPSLIRLVVQELLRTNAGEIRVGDAPIQSCDFSALLERTGLGEWANKLVKTEKRFAGIADFRRTTCGEEHGVRIAVENKVGLDHYVLFDLGVESLLEPITTEISRFRITSYDPKFLAETHRPGRHQYLITREVLEADVVINLPKLKMHKKAGVTNALKNLVGINGNKEYLPHHRIGGSEEAGDCYPGKHRLKKGLEVLYDAKNSTGSQIEARVISKLMKPLSRMLSITGDKIGIEGSWSGNDTVWRMTLDLNRILLYGRTDGTLADTPQRRVIHLCDAIIAGQGNGPLSPEPFEIGVLLGGNNPAAVDLAGANLLGLDPERIPLIVNAFKNFQWPIANFSSSTVQVLMRGGEISPARLTRELALQAPQKIPAGWIAALNTRELTLG